MVVEIRHLRYFIAVAELRNFTKAAEASFVAQSALSQRDWARGETYGPVTDIVKQHGGAYGLGLHYAGDFIGGHAG